MCWVHRSFLWQLWNLSSIIFTQLDSTILTFVSLRNDFGKVANHSEIPDQFQTYQPLSKVLNGLTWLDPFQSSHGHHKIPIFRAYPAPGERKKSMALGTWRERDNGHLPTELSKPRAPGRSIQIPSGMITERPKSFRSSTFIKALIKPTVISQSSEYIPLLGTQQRRSRCGQTWRVMLRCWIKPCNLGEVDKIDKLQKKTANYLDENLPPLFAAEIRELVIAMFHHCIVTTNETYLLHPAIPISTSKKVTHCIQNVLTTLLPITATIKICHFIHPPIPLPSGNHKWFDDASMKGSFTVEFQRLVDFQCFHHWILQLAMFDYQMVYLHYWTAKHIPYLPISITPIGSSRCSLKIPSMFHLPSHFYHFSIYFSMFDDSGYQRVATWYCWACGLPSWPDSAAIRCTWWPAAGSNARPASAVRELHLQGCRWWKVDWDLVNLVNLCDSIV